MTTVHTPLDTRIFLKECRSLAAAGFPVTLVAPAAPTGVRDGVTLYPIPQRGSRWSRMLVGPWEAWRAARGAGGRVFHLHDPELLGIGCLLKLLGHRVIYDIHEDVPSQVLAKPWIPRSVRGLVGAGIAVLEAVGARVFDALVCATPTIRARFPNCRAEVVRNYPILQEFGSGVRYDERPAIVTYVGALVPERGLWTMLEAAPYLREQHRATLVIAGRFASRDLEISAQAHPGWGSVDFRGWLGRDEVVRLLATSRVGIVPLHRTPAYEVSLPVKMFEYMAAGIPVVASDFPIWREIIEGEACGVLVEPANAPVLAALVGQLLANPSEAEAMGRRGRAAVQRRYAWASEARTLIALYDSVLAGRHERGEYGA